MGDLGKIRRLVELLEQGYEGQDKKLDEIFKSNEEFITKLNKEQLFQGETADEGSTGEYSSKWYADYKSKLNPNNVVDLFVTGNFYDGFFVRIVKGGFEIDSKDSKRAKLVSKYGKEIFGLNQESRETLIKDVILPELTKYWREVLQLR
jgi:hypothetical protein